MFDLQVQFKFSQDKESYNNLAAPNFLLSLNKAQVRTDNGEGAGSNMAQLLRSVLANPDP